MSERSASPKLTGQFSKALVYAEAKHHTQTRKGGNNIPYIGHLLSVAGMVIEAGGDETQAIAALLHDAVEDAGGPTTLKEIRDVFGDEIAAIVSECSDTDQTPKPPWRKRKEDYIAHLGDASDAAILVSLADKVDNARATLRDLHIEGPAVWQRFSVHDPQEHLWYYGGLLKVYRDRSTSWLVDELQRVLDEMKRLVAGSANHISNTAE
jgi:(p)ppGpp synthase/HD superfamily hydrolase